MKLKIGMRVLEQHASVVIKGAIPKAVKCKEKQIDVE
jgi:hypothetical protein